MTNDEPTLFASHLNRIYLDNAATSWPKPESVYQAVDRYQRTLGVAAGRGSYRAAEEVNRTLGQARLAVARLIGACSPSQIVFTQNCTDSLNLALHGLLKPGDHVITSHAEHNSILRPLSFLNATKGVKMTSVSVNSSGMIDVNAIKDSVLPETRLIAITHASNVTGSLQPIHEIGQLAETCGCVFLLDAAQTLGHVPIDVVASRVDLLAAPGHKGLLGPLGTGVLYIRDGLEQQILPIRQGGTGTQSELAEQPEQLPSKYESGNLNVPGIYGLQAGVEFVVENDLTRSPHLHELSRQLVAALRGTPEVSVYSDANPCGIVSFQIRGYDPREVATLLDASAEIQVRAGLHCAPEMHRELGTFDQSGTVRASFGHFSTTEDVDKLIAAVRMLAEHPVG